MQLLDERHIHRMSEHSWRLITLLIFFAVLIPFAAGVRWVVDGLPPLALAFGAGIAVGVFICQLLDRWDERQRSNSDP